MFIYTHRKELKNNLSILCAFYITFYIPTTSSMQVGKFKENIQGRFSDQIHQRCLFLLNMLISLLFLKHQIREIKLSKLNYVQSSSSVFTKELKTPQSGVSTEGGGDTAISWKWFADMHAWV